MHTGKFAFGHLVQNKQASQSSWINNGACQSAGVNTDEERLMEMSPHRDTAYGTHLFYQEEGCTVN